MNKVFVFDPTASDKLSAARGVGRYLQILKESFGKGWIFTDFLKRIPTDSVFINPFYNFLQPPLILRRIAKKQIAVVHDLIPLKYPSHFPAGIRGKINIWLNKLALKNYDLIITDSEASKQDIIKILRLPKEKIKIIYPCLPKSFTSRHPERSEGSRQSRNTRIDSSVAEPALSKIEWLPQNDTEGRFCLYVGDATWNKNLVNLAKAIKIINITCVFVGKVFKQAAGVVSEVSLREADGGIDSRASQERRDHERQNLPRASNDWNFEFNEFLKLTKDDKRFIFAGFLKDYELIKLYQQARCNILVSRDEGFGFSYLEAANFGCPSVLSNISVIKEIAGKNSSFFVDPNDTNQIANAIGEIYFNNEVRNKLGFKAQQRSNFFSQKKFKNGWKGCL